MHWKKAEKNDEGFVSIPDRWLHLYYYEALNVLFRFENALRVFVYIVLKKEFKDKWSDASISTGGTIRSETKSRMAKAREHAYLGYELSSPMLYLNSGELIDIIVSEAYWKHFKPYFKASKSIVETKLKEIGMVRNSLAHFRPIKEDDIDLTKQNTKHVLMEIETCLTQITSITTTVPTNTEDDWYKLIKPIGSDNIRMSLFHSDDEEWVRIVLNHSIPTLQKNKVADVAYTYKLGNFRTDQIFSKYPILKGTCIYISEGNLVGGVNTQNFDVDGRKQISIVFPQKTLKENLQSIVKTLNEIVLIVDEETDLLQQDHLARGSLIETKSSTATLRAGFDGRKRWHISLSGMQTPVSANTEVEFWGTRSHFESDFISGSDQYPWMPSTISQKEIPF